MLTGIWTIGIKVRDLEQELAFHRAIGNEIVLDEMIEFEGAQYRIPLVKMGDKYLHIMEQMVYEKSIGETRPIGSTHLVYMSDDFDNDVERIRRAGASELAPVSDVSAGFGDRRVAFFRAPGGWFFEVIHVIRHRVPEV
ncbi:MAG: VOC family protein [Anaerolineae bacterium]|nr:VOC family protein [Anaerolineae bacterium]